ncbi:MAG: hypothetical protein EWM45_12365 [Rhodopseudomonas palustris]|uniref:hypothetical protein n=1 Tax=Rhodopseudomonas faecalis TaxID=99655 RepID=UPI000DA1C007|nr:hypothetical protein [Rhodopseudomonas faecalis]TAH66200.1 MAG: hypothetical protein EWM45_12365 [Rhodopseudomonas palustris]
MRERDRLRDRQAEASEALSFEIAGIDAACELEQPSASSSRASGDTASLRSFAALLINDVI